MEESNKLYRHSGRCDPAAAPCLPQPDIRVVTIHGATDGRSLDRPHRLVPSVIDAAYSRTLD